MRSEVWMGSEGMRTTSWSVHFVFDCFVVTGEEKAVCKYVHKACLDVVSVNWS